MLEETLQQACSDPLASICKKFPTYYLLLAHTCHLELGQDLTQRYAHFLDMLPMFCFPPVCDLTFNPADLWLQSFLMDRDQFRISRMHHTWLVLPGLAQDNTRT